MSLDAALSDVREHVSRALDALRRHAGEPDCPDDVFQLYDELAEARRAATALQERGRYRQRPPGREYAVLLSSASSKVYPDLVLPEVHGDLQAAISPASSVSAMQGVEFVIMQRDSSSDPWLEHNTGRTAVEAIRHHWGS